MGMNGKIRTQKIHDDDDDVHYHYPLPRPSETVGTRTRSRLLDPEADGITEQDRTPSINLQEENRRMGADGRDGSGEGGSD